MPLILAKSSSGGCYEVSFEIIDGRLFTGCGCAAGMVQQLCKHLKAVLMGDCSMLFNPDQESDLQSALISANLAGVIADHAELQTQLNELDLELKREKQRIEKSRKMLKATFMRKLTDGYLSPATVAN
jgi:hypothetical protein